MVSISDRPANDDGPAELLGALLGTTRDGFTERPGLNGASLLRERIKGSLGEGDGGADGSRETWTRSTYRGTDRVGNNLVGERLDATIDECLGRETTVS